MKKSFIVLLVTILVIASLFFWIFNSDFQFNVSEILMFAALVIIIAFAIFMAWSRIKSEKKGEPFEDEFSKKIMRKASSMAFYTSIYAWLIFSYLNDSWQLEGHTLVGVGILGMVIIFVIYWVFYKIRGVKDA